MKNSDFFTPRELILMRLKSLKKVIKEQQDLNQDVSMLVERSKEIEDILELIGNE